ncbi:MAG: murein hydrolase activator EnvC family protein [Bacillota bacterium]
MKSKTMLSKYIPSAILIGALIFCIYNKAEFVSGIQDDQLNAEIQELNAKIQAQKQQLDDLAAQQKAYNQAIAAKQAEKDDLSSQLSLIEDRANKTQLELQSAQIELSKTELEAKKISLDIVDTNARISQQKDHIATLLRLVYRQDQVSALEALLLNDSISEFLNQSKYLQNANTELKESLYSLEVEKERLDRSEAEVKSKQAELAKIKAGLEAKKDQLQYEQNEKNYLLEETKSSERAYQDLLAQAKRQAAQAAADIANMENVVRDKMSQANKDRLANSDSAIAWPVAGRTITATFHDPDYPFRRIIGEHSGVDIRSKQGSPLYAAADGYVARVKFDGSTAYAYIMIIHDDGISTVYGHVSGANVAADQYVVKGQQIGKTGGAPGMPGSGPFSTGSHLHFEIRKNGIPVDPLNYLP